VFRQNLNFIVVLLFTFNTTSSQPAIAVLTRFSR
jgi:hypothetical protein